MKRIKRKALIIIGILALLVIGVAYFLFGFYDQNESLQGKLPHGLLMIGIVFLMIFVFSKLDKPYQTAIEESTDN